MYFSPFPRIEYTINGKTEEVIDLFRRVAISKNPPVGSYNEIVVTDMDTIESLAEKYYDDPNLSWIIAVTNNMIDPIEEFPKSSALLNFTFNTKYQGNILYLEENIDLIPGDIIIEVKSSVSTNTAPSALTSADLNSSKFCFVNSYNNEFRYARVTHESSLFTAGGKIAAFRKQGDVLSIIGFMKQATNVSAEAESCVLQIKKVDTYLNSPVYMFNPTDNSLISPYQKFSGTSLIDDFVKLDATGTYTDLVDDNAFRQSVLFKVIMDNGIVNDVSMLKLKDDLKIKNDKFRRLKIIPREILPSFLETFNELMSGSETRSRLISTKV
jgi:hypothetical protein